MKIATMKKPSGPKPLADLIGACVGHVFERQGFASREIVTHWDEIVGTEVAAHAEPLRMNWVRTSDPDDMQPATLVLRVEGPAAIEIQHMSGLIVERVNRYFGWQAISGIALRQAPLARRNRKPRRAKIDDARAAALAAEMTGITDERLRAALGRLAAAIKPA